MTFPNTMRAYLLRVDEKTWRQIRAQVRWAYVKGAFTPPRRLARFIPVALPADPTIWHAYAKDITATRKHIRSETVRAKRKAKTLKKLKAKRAYQRDYMREYRDRLRRHTS